MSKKEHDGCVKCKYEHDSSDSKNCLGCKQNAIDKYIARTNADKIRSMSDAELAKALVEIDEDYICQVFCRNICRLRDNNCPVAVKNEDCPINTEDCISGWLKSEVSE